MTTEQIKVYTLAQELQLSSREVIQELRAMGFNVISAAATLTSRQAQAVRNKINAEWTASASAKEAWAKSAATPRSDDWKVPVSEPSRYAFARCGCCKLGFRHEQATPPIWCVDCGEHFEHPGEDVARTIARLTAHDRLLRKRHADMEAHISKLTAESCAELESTYAKKRKWEAALTEVMLLHGKHPATGQCTCGSERFPCRSMKRLDQVNVGIARRVEKLVSMDDDVRNDVLYSEDLRQYIDVTEARDHAYDTTRRGASQPS
jgi:hypothetical protein